MTSAQKTPPPDPGDEIATARIELRHTDPPIWREVEVPTSITLEGLHEIVQAVMGWFDYHLWEFTVGKVRYGPPQDDEDWGEGPREEAARVRLRSVLGDRRTRIDYIYDFGDYWEVRITVTGVRAGEPGTGYPRYVAGENAAPPEDCGGVPGFYHWLEVRADPAHPEHADALAVLGEQPETIDPQPIRDALGRMARRRSAGRKRGTTPSGG